MFLGQQEPNIHVVKFRPDGVPDTTFGAGGFVSIECPHCIAKDVVELSDGKFLLAGETNFMVPEQPTDLLLARLNADGSLDTTFGTNGFVFHDLQIEAGRFSDEHLFEIALSPDGGILAAAITGLSTNHINKDANGLLIKFLPNGNLDPSFGFNGFRREPLGTEPTANAASMANISTFANGKIAASFYARVRAANGTDLIEKSILKKYLASGAADDTFSTVNFDSYPVMDIAAAADNGTLTLSGKKLYKYTPGGTLDLSFGASGEVTFPNASFPGFLSLQSSGKIYVTGYKAAQNGRNPGEIYRLWPNGLRDLRFGRSGSVLVRIAPQHTFLGPAFKESDGTLGLTGTVIPNNVHYVRILVAK
ncbi:MAG: hypothetical protein LC113_03685 [Acidobacteria bacterium]|nr:hypothetical protein [Acidobacteriota bacterium]